MGQNFLVDPNHCRRIAEVVSQICRAESSVPPAASGPVRVLEIGPGLGALTQALLAAKLAVTAVELDPVLAEILRKEFSPEIQSGHALRLIESDARKVLAEPDAFGVAGDLRFVCGNLPYYITSDLLTATVALADLRGACFLTQLEFAERAAAPDARSSLSVYLANFGDWTVTHRVPAGAFYPVPGVGSAVLCMKTLPGGPHCDGILLQAILRAAFHARRKRLRNSWKGALPAHLPLEEVLDQARSVNLDPDLRAEQIDKAAYYRLVQSLSARRTS